MFPWLPLVCVLLLATSAFGQDMPLFTFAKLGEKWVSTKEPSSDPIPPSTAMFGRETTSDIVTQDRVTIYVGYTNRAAVWAFPMKDGMPDLNAGAPYAPLRIVEGYDNSREARERAKANPPTLAVTALLLDPAGRLYAATAKDIQVFDPTGRPCGSLPLPASGTVESMKWEPGNVPKLAVWASGAKWTREMK